MLEYVRDIICVHCETEPVKVVFYLFCVNMSLLFQPFLHSNGDFTFEMRINV